MLMKGMDKHLPVRDLATSLSCSPNNSLNKKKNQKAQICERLPVVLIKHRWIELNEKALKCQC